MNSLPTTSALLDPLLALQHLELREGMRVADLGCGGHGHFVFPLAASVGPNGIVYAVDILKTALASIESRARHEGVRQVIPVWTDLEVIDAPGIEPGTIDRAVIVNALSQAKNPEVMMRRAARLLKQSGKLMAIEWRPEHTFFGPPIEQRLMPTRLSEIASSAGLQAKEQFAPGQHHYAFVFEKL